MVDKMKFTEEIIIRYLDGELSQQEVQSFEEELKIDKTFADLYERHIAIHNSLSNNKLSSPTPDFTSRVMQSVASLKFSNAKFFNKTRLYVLLLIAIAVATTLYYISSQFYPAIGGALTNEITLKSFTLNLQPAQQLLSSDLIFKIVFYVNGLVSLLLLDRAVLKPYFARRKQRYSM
jgi:hypothetical protein